MSQRQDGMNEALQVLSYLLSGIAVYGFLGWLGDRYLHTNFLLPLGIVLGAAGGIYLIVRRFGKGTDSSGSTMK